MAGLYPLARCLTASLITRRTSVSCISHRSLSSEAVRDRTEVRRQRRSPRNNVSSYAPRPSMRDERIESDEPSFENATSAPSTRGFNRRPHRGAHSARPTSFNNPSASRSNWNIHRQPVGEFVYGFHPVVAALHANKREVHAVYLQGERDTADDSNAASSSSALHREHEKQELHAAIQRYSPRLIVEYLSRQQLNLLSDDRPHNGVVIDAAPLQPPLSDTLPAPVDAESAATSASPLWLLLDEVQDPQNLGAILRSAAFFNATGVVLCKKNCAPLSPVASKASSGCLETIDVRWCKSTMRLIDEAKKAGWRVVGLSAEEMSEAKRVRDCRGFEVSGPTVLVLGNEGRGMRTLVRKSCDELLSIRGSGSGVNAASEVVGPVLLDSLNVSTAVAIALYQCSHKRSSAV